MEAMMITPSVIIREAKPRDVDILYEMGIVEEGFVLSPRTRFYGKNYLRSWVGNPGDDILLVAEIANEIVGFLFCRLIRGTWAMLENIAVSPEKRKQGVGTLLIEECFRQLLAKGINYTAGIVKEENSNAEFFVKKGFSFGNRFVWIERHQVEEISKQKQ